MHRLLKNIIISKSSQIAMKHTSTSRSFPRGSGMNCNKLQNNEISVVSYNILCDKFANPQSLINVPTTILDYSARWPILKSEFKQFNSDIIALQEVPVLENRFEDMKTYMKDTLGYDCVQMLKHDHNDVKLALFWKSSRFTLKWWEERSRALLAELKLIEHDNTNNSTTNNNTNTINNSIYIINVHLEANPLRVTDRVCQIKHALQRLAHHITSTSDNASINTSHIILLGDLNSTSHEAAYTFLKEGTLPKGYIDPIHNIQATDEDIFHPFGVFHDAYEDAHAVPAFTRFVKNEGTGGATLDFILCSDGVEVCAVMDPLAEEHVDVVEECGLPNQFNPSDHLPVGAVLKLKKP